MFSKFKKSPILKYILFLIIGTLSLLALFFTLVYVGSFGKIPNKENLQSIQNDEASLVYSSDTIIIGKYFDKNRTNITISELPLHLKNALIATEDKRFFEHKGVDIQSYFRVFVKSILLQQSSGGGSTLTQQLAKNLFGRQQYKMLSLPIQKIKEIVIASRLETIYSKEELLILYLNTVPFGENVFGIEAAANRYFNKTTQNLTIEEAAVLVGMLKATTNFNPRLYPKKSLERRNLVLKLMSSEGYLTAIHLDSLIKSPIQLDYENMEIEPPAGYFVNEVKKQTKTILNTIEKNTGKKYLLEKDGLKIYTTLNMELQKIAKKAVKNHLKKMQPLLDAELNNSNFKKNWLKNQQKKSNLNSNDLVERPVELFDWDEIKVKKMSRLDSLWHYYKMLHSAVLITNPKNGTVLSYIGGNNFRKLPFNMVESHRQIASAFKPILYATALEYRLSPDTYLENTEKEYPEFENWKPQNFDYQSTPNQKVALWYALTNSMNLPTVDLYFKVAPENLFQTMRDLEFPSVKTLTPSMALGTLDISLKEIVKAYGTFANMGIMNSLVLIEKIEDKNGNIVYENKELKSKKVFSEYTSENITAILQNAINEGTGTKIRSQFGIKSDVAGKTGTAQNYSNAWFVAYTPNLVIGTWVGAATPNVHFSSGKGSGSSLALPISGAIFQQIENSKMLKNNYLTPFEISEDTYSYLATEPFQEVGVEGFFKRLFNFKLFKNKKDNSKKRNR